MPRLVSAHALLEGDRVALVVQKDPRSNASLWQFHATVDRILAIGGEVQLSAVHVDSSGDYSALLFANKVGFRVGHQMLLALLPVLVELVPIVQVACGWIECPRLRFSWIVGDLCDAEEKVRVRIENFVYGVRELRYPRAYDL